MKHESFKFLHWVFRNHAKWGNIVLKYSFWNYCIIQPFRYWRVTSEEYTLCNGAASYKIQFQLKTVVFFMCVFVRFMQFRHNLLPSSLSQSYQILAILMKNLAIVDQEFLWRFTQSVTKCYQQKSWIM